LIRVLIDSDGLEILRMESRTKTVESFRNKLLRPEKDGKSSDLSDMTDISGIRCMRSI